MRAGKLALIRPVMTSTLGRWVADHQVNAHRTRHLCQAGERALVSSGRCIIKSPISSMIRAI